MFLYRKISPTILLDVPEASSMMQEEIFGPLLPVITVQKIEDGFQVIRSKPKPLAAYLFTNSAELQKQFVQNVSAGGMTINDTVLHVKKTSFLIQNQCSVFHNASSY